VRDDRPLGELSREQHDDCDKGPSDDDSPNDVGAPALAAS
jgi:hypothetical protein